MRKEADVVGMLMSGWLQMKQCVININTLLQHFTVREANKAKRARGEPLTTRSDAQDGE